MGTVDRAVFWWNILVSWWWHWKLRSVKEIFPEINWCGKWGWENRAPRQHPLRRVILWINTAQEHGRSVLHDCVTLDNLHHPCAAACLFVKQRKDFTTYWENEFISACEVFANKVCDKHQKNNTLLSIQKVAAKVTLKEHGMTQLKSYVSVLVP